MKFRILHNGIYYRAQVRTFLFWRDLNQNGYRTGLSERYLTGESSARANIENFLRNCRSERNQRAPWSVKQEWSVK